MNCNDGYGPNGSPTPYPTSVYKQDFINIMEFESEHERFVESIEQEADDAPISTSMREKLTEKGWVPISALENFTEWVVVDFCIATIPENLSVPLYYHLAYTDFLGSEDGVADDYLVSDMKGYNFVVECLARNVLEDKVKLNSPVTEIKWNDNCVCATVNGNEQYCGEYAIVTFSIGVLQYFIREENTMADVTFPPELPQPKKDAILSVPMVYYARVFLIFNDDITFLNRTDDSYQQVIRYVSHDRGYYPVYIHDRHHPNIITVDVTGDLALDVEKQEPNKTQDDIMKILREMYGKNIPDPQHIVVSNWSNDPFFRGVWTAFDVGTPLNELLSPVGRLYFAGESLNKSHYGYTHGAYGSGAHVAMEIISEINGKLNLHSFTILYFTCRFARSHKSSCMWDACISCSAGWAV